MHDNENEGIHCPVCNEDASQGMFACGRCRDEQRAEEANWPTDIDSPFLGLV